MISPLMSSTRSSSWRIPVSPMRKYSSAVNSFLATSVFMHPLCPKHTPGANRLTRSAPSGESTSKPTLTDCELLEFRQNNAQEIANSQDSSALLRVRKPCFASTIVEMKFMLLVHHDEESFRKRPETERQRLLQESVQLAHELHASGQYLSAAPLHPSSETACVRVRDGRPIVTDGPFAETREQLGGYFLIDAKDRNEAIRIASRIPGARIGTVEVRCVTEVAGLPGE